MHHTVEHDIEKVIALRLKFNFKGIFISLAAIAIFAWLVQRSQNVLIRIGATADVAESISGLVFKARVDTGASICSIHCYEILIADESENPLENIGAEIRFLLKNGSGKSKWIEGKIADYSSIRTMDATKPRYHVRLTLFCLGVEREVLVTLADRGHMKYRMLLGRNFLKNRFVVDVSKENSDFH